MKRFLLFTCMTHYPDGGWKDFRGDFDTLEDAMKGWKDIQNETMKRGWMWDRGHIVDSQDKEIVEHLYKGE